MSSEQRRSLADGVPSHVKNILKRNLKSYESYMAKKNAVREAPPSSDPSSGGSSIRGSSSIRGRMASRSRRVLMGIDSEVSEGHYVKNSFAEAKRSHKEITKRKKRNLDGFLKKWSGTNVTDEHKKAYSEWFMGYDNPSSSKTKKVEVKDLTRPPYAPYNKYELIKRRNSSD